MANAAAIIVCLSERTTSKQLQLVRSVEDEQKGVSRAVLFGVSGPIL
jgi:hypothetical protein